MRIPFAQLFCKHHCRGHRQKHLLIHFIQPIADLRPMSRYWGPTGWCTRMLCGSAFMACCHIRNMGSEPIPQKRYTLCLQAAHIGNAIPRLTALLQPLGAHITPLGCRTLPKPQKRRSCRSMLGMVICRKMAIGMKVCQSTRAHLVQLGSLRSGGLLSHLQDPCEGDETKALIIWGWRLHQKKVRHFAIIRR